MLMFLRSRTSSTLLSNAARIDGNGVEEENVHDGRIVNVDNVVLNRANVDAPVNADRIDGNGVEEEKVHDGRIVNVDNVVLHRADVDAPVDADAYVSPKSYVVDAPVERCSD